MKIGYARVSTADQDTEAQTQALVALGCEPRNIYVDHGHTGTNRLRPALVQALAACREGDTLVVTKLDRLARSIGDAHEIAADLERRGTSLAFGGSVYDPTDPMGRMLFGMLAVIAEFEVNLIRQRTREGMAIARAKGRLRGRKPLLSPAQDAHVAGLLDGGTHTPGEVAALMGVGRTTVYRAAERHRARQAAK